MCAEINSQIREEPKILTPFTTIQIIQASSKKFGTNTKKVFLVDTVTKHISNILTEFDSDQKCLMFKLLAGMELYLHSGRAKLPGIIYTLKEQLKESLDALSETGVINILEAYQNLPADFPVDLLEEIKEMVIVTMQHNSVAIKSFFLIDFLDKISLLRRNRRLNDEKINLIFDEVAKRLPNDEFLSKFKTMERILQIHERVNGKSNALLQAVFKVLTESNNPWFSASIVQILIKNKIDVSKVIEKFLASDSYKKTDAHNLVKNYLVFTILEGDKYEQVIQEMKEKIMAQSENLVKYISIIAESGINNNAATELLQLGTQAFREN